MEVTLPCCCRFLADENTREKTRRTIQMHARHNMTPTRFIEVGLVGSSLHASGVIQATSRSTLNNDSDD
jgi:hypothetical protein